MKKSGHKINIFTFILIWSMWFLASLTYSHQYFLRQVVSTLSHYLINDFFLTIVDLTDLAALFFISYVLTLPFSGVLIDRYGVKRMLPLSLIIAAISCFLFYLAKTDVELIIARLLMGAYATFTLISSYTIIKKYFHANLFPLLSGLTLTIGLTGAICGSFILLKFTAPFNWRASLLYAGFFALVIALLFFISVHLHDTKYSTHKNNNKSMKIFFKDCRFFLKKWSNWLTGLYGGCVLTPIIAFASFWATPFLKLHYHMDHLKTTYFISATFVGYAIGAPIIAVLAQKVGLKEMMVLSSALASAMLTLITVSNFNEFFLINCFILLGFTAGAFALSTILIKLSIPEDITASAFSFNTMIAQLFGAFILWVMGEFIYYFHKTNLVNKQNLYSEIVLQHTMYLLIIVSLLGLVIACVIPFPKKRGTETKI
ncbi:major facilitator family transporter (Permease) [Legionella gratiana]|uniref:Lysosomal dipeptide transporter MFSD1 n=1 Tax=Legionella gratiana TaxID=45066 RepID=A0A378JEL4_9GAMM|nr:MFS transporter [Legionella gratiana]KTD12052.1 major facilitator family transporter (Permease) [Legionella gratiana]STX46344.1 major facilitator family transporter (Permease) [Legionella gratiana]